MVDLKAVSVDRDEYRTAGCTGFRPRGGLLSRLAAVPGRADEAGGAGDQPVGAGTTCCIAVGDKDAGRGGDDPRGGRRLATHYRRNSTDWRRPIHCSPIRTSPVDNKFHGGRCLIAN